MILWIILLFICFTFVSAHQELEDKNESKYIKWMIKASFYFFIFWIFFQLIIYIPSPEDLWKVRLNLIKYRLASPQNVNQGVKQIQDIADKLEKKYLGDGK